MRFPPKVFTLPMSLLLVTTALTQPTLAKGPKRQQQPPRTETVAAALPDLGLVDAAPRVGLALAAVSNSPTVLQTRESIPDFEVVEPSDQRPTQTDAQPLLEGDAVPPVEVHPTLNLAASDPDLPTPPPSVTQLAAVEAQEQVPSSQPKQAITGVKRSTSIALFSDDKDSDSLTRLKAALGADTLEKYIATLSIQADSFNFPHVLRVQSDSTEVSAEFNTLYEKVMETFFKTYQSDQQTNWTTEAQKLSEAVAKHLLDIIKIKEEEKERHVLAKAKSPDTQAPALDPLIEQLEKSIATYKGLLGQALYHLTTTHSFVVDTLKDIQIKDETLSDLTPKATETNTDILARYKEARQSAENALGFLKTSLRQSEALMHALYPYHRQWKSGRIGISMPDSERHALSTEMRLKVTGDGNRVKAFEIKTKDAPLTRRYNQYLKEMLAPQSLQLDAAKAEGRIVLEALSIATETAETAATVAPVVDGATETRTSGLRSLIGALGSAFWPLSNKAAATTTLALAPTVTEGKKEGDTQEPAAQPSTADAVVIETNGE